MADLKGKTLFISGASRGIGMAIGLRAARDGANVAIAAKTAEPHPKLPGTIYTAAEAMESVGGKALPLICDIRFEDQVAAAVEKTVDTFGTIDILVNNASAIALTPTTQTPMKRYDLMNAVNARGTFLCSQKCIPYLTQGDNPHILNISPPLIMESRWFAPHVAYSMAKIGMSLCVLGMADELKPDGIAVNALWPKTLIDTAAVRNIVGGPDMASRGRKPDIMADAAHAILNKPARDCTGNFFIDEDLLRQEGTSDFDQYAVTPGADLVPDFFT